MTTRTRSEFRIVSQPRHDTDAHPAPRASAALVSGVAPATERQRVTRQDATDFFVDSGLSGGDERRAAAAVKTESVLVTCQAGLDKSSTRFDQK